MVATETFNVQEQQGQRYQQKERKDSAQADGQEGSCCTAGVALPAHVKGIVIQVLPSFVGRQPCAFSLTSAKQSAELSPLSQDEVAVVRDKLARLKQMAARNANDRVISAQVLPQSAPL